MGEKEFKFDVEAEADAFIQGLETAVNMLDSDHLTYDKVVDGEGVTVVVSVSY